MKKIINALSAGVAIAALALAQVAPADAQILAAHNHPFGVNMSGPEFAPWNGQTFPTATDYAYLAARGVTFVRLPIAWESIEPTLGGALNTTYLGNVQTAISTAWSYGISTIVEIHNFSQWCQQSSWVSSGCGYAGNVGNASAGVNYMGDGTLTQANFNTLWGDIAQALVGTPGLIGYGLMNEPGLNVPGTNTLYAPTNLLYAPNGFNAGIGLHPWNVINGAVATPLWGVANPISASYGPPWRITAGTGYGAVNQNTVIGSGNYILSCDLKSDPTNPITTPQLQINNTGTNPTITASWARYSSQVQAPGAGSTEVLIGANAAAGAIDAANCDLRAGSTAATDLTYQPNAYLPWAQSASTAIRVYDSVTPIYVDGINSSPAAFWQQSNWELASLTGGPFIFDAHYYPDGTLANGGGGGNFSGSFSSYSVNNFEGQQGFAPFLAWCATANVKCFSGEFGIPNLTTDSDAQWLTLSTLFYKQLHAAGIPATLWFYGSNGIQPTSALNVAPTSVTTNAVTATSSATLHFASLPASITAANAGSTIRDLTTPSAIPGGTTISSATSTTIVMNQNAAGAGVGSGDIIQVDDLRLTQMLAVP